MARQLWLLRHGEAVPHDPVSDSARRLTERGEAQAGFAGAALRELDLVFQMVFASPKVRAAETARIACEHLGVAAMSHAPLAGGFSQRDALELVASAGEDRRTLLVGHDPDFTQLVHDLCGARVEFNKGGVAGVRLRPGGGGGELMVMLRPRELERIAG